MNKYSLNRYSPNIHSLKRPLARFALIFLALALMPQAVALACSPTAALARALFEGEAEPGGGLPLEVTYQIDEMDIDADGSTLPIQIEAQARLAALRAQSPDATFCLTIVLDDGDLYPIAHQQRISLPSLGSASTWTYRVEIALPEEASQILLILEEPERGLRSAAFADEASSTLPPPGTAAVHLAGGAWHQLAGGAKVTSAARREAAVLRLVPPRKQPTGASARFDVLVSSDDVKRIVFFVDDQEVDSRRRRPFAARLPLAEPPRPQEVRAVAYGRDNLRLGEHTITVNLIDAPFRVRIEELRVGNDAVLVEADVAVPAEATLDRVEIYRNEQLVERLERPPWRARVPASGVTMEDYVRVAAFLSDGTSIDDVALLGDPGAVEEVDVNLVELRVVVIDDEGEPIEDLTAEDFAIVDSGRPRAVADLAYADDVPLLLGLVIDTSGSMRLIMDSTKKAAARFLGDALREQDRAFLVDFDKRPRLLSDTTGELSELLFAFARLEAEGATALYDAVVFSMLQFAEPGGRRALVVLTDGDDRESRFGPKDAIAYGQKAGVPIYIIALGALDDQPRLLPVKELSRVTRQTGGNLYRVSDLDELAQAYAEIQAELRSQYTLSFYAERDLDAEERRRLEVRVARPDAQTRTVVAPGGAP